MKRSRAAIGTAIVTSTLTSLALLATSPSATAEPTRKVIAKELTTPLQFDVDGNRFVVGETFAGLLTRIQADGDRKVLHAEEGAEVAGVSVDGDNILFTTTNMSGEPGAFLKIRKADGTVRKVADLRAFEAEFDPDADVTYGIRGLTQECEDSLPDGEMDWGPHGGIVDAHPYAVANGPGRSWYVAEAAGNTILQVFRNGTVEVVDVVAPRRLKVTEAAAEANNLPACTIGKTYWAESVPTDVEVDSAGRIVASLLPGGPEDPSFGANGAVVRYNPETGRTKTLASGFAAATNVAVAPNGAIFVTQLFGGLITKITQDGDVRPFVETAMPSGLEWSDGRVFATIETLGEGGGKLVRFTP